jgi:ABC-2 type transport system permease protein
MNALVVAGAAIRRILRDRTALFFLVLLPAVVILVVGATVGGHDEFRVGVVARDDGALASALVDELRGSSAVTVTTYTDEGRARTAVRRAERDAVVIIPAGLDSLLANGGKASVTLVAGGAPTNRQAVYTAVSVIVARHAARVQAATFASARAGGTFDTNLSLAGRLAASTPAVTVRTEVVNNKSDILPAGFAYSAPTMLVLFVFVNALAGGAAMIQTRKLGIYERVMAAPVRARDIVLGETLCYLTVAFFQSLLIIGMGAALFGVSWGNPLAATALVAVWALVGTGAGMLSGTLFRTPEQASAIGPAVGIALGMLGGCMWPLAIVTPVMQSIGHLAPQAWAVDGWTALLSRDGHVVDIAKQLAVLAGFAVALLTLAILRLRRRLVG